MRAIRGPIIFLAIAAGWACQPDLSRKSGALEIRVLGLLPEADIVRAVVVGGSSRFVTEAPAVSFSGALSAESVAVGVVDVEVQAILGSTTLASVRSSAVVEEGVRTFVTADFGAAKMRSDAGGRDEGRRIDSNPISLTISGLRSSRISAGALGESEHVTQDGGAYQRFMEDVRRVLGTDPAAIEVQTLTVDLLEDTARDVSGLEDLWSSVSILLRSGGSGEIEIASLEGPMGSGAVPLEISGSRTALAPIFGELLLIDFSIVARGPTPRSPEENFQADVRITTIYSALER